MSRGIELHGQMLGSGLYRLVIFQQLSQTADKELNTTFVLDLGVPRAIPCCDHLTLPPVDMEPDNMESDRGKDNGIPTPPVRFHVDSWEGNLIFFIQPMF